MAYTLDEYIKQVQKANAKAEKTAIKDVNDLYASQKAATEGAYNEQIDLANKAYEDQYRANAVQKEVNQRMVAENMANMGLTDSGLNRTQQTAVQLSYANQKAATDRKRLEQIDAFKREMTNQLATIEQNRLGAVANVKNEYNKLNTEQGTSAYNNMVEQTTKYNTALLKNNNGDSYIIPTNGSLLSRDYTGRLSDSGVTSYRIKKKDALGTEVDYVKYVDGNSGKVTELPLGYNPYNGQYHKDVLGKDGKYDPSKAFKGNGYQPNNVNGDPLYDSGITDQINGNTQIVWQTKDGTKYIWDGTIADYKIYVD
jgi:hypothetical protein